MINDALKKAPVWALWLTIGVMSVGATYGLHQHLSEVQSTSFDLQETRDLVRELVVVVEYNYKETERNTEERRVSAEKFTEIQTTLARIEAQLDKE